MGAKALKPSCPAVVLEKINKSYPVGQGKLHVLKDVSLTVEKGEFTAVLGASGSGKSTLMNVVGCMDTADDGAYLLDGQAVNGSSSEQLSEIRNRKIGFVFQKYHLISQYTVEENVIIPLLARGMSRKEALEKASVWIEQVGLTDWRLHKPSQLSGGQQQRTAIARALAGDPELLLADEPTGALDSKTGKEILDLFEKLNCNGQTIVMITHDLNVAARAKRRVLLKDGELFESD